MSPWQRGVTTSPLKRRFSDGRSRGTNNHAGTQEKYWDQTNNELISMKMVLSFCLSCAYFTFYHGGLDHVTDHALAKGPLKK